MKFSLICLSLFIVSALAVSEPKTSKLEFQPDKLYTYDYTGQIFAGIIPGSSLHSGTQLKAKLEFSNRNVDGKSIIVMKMNNVVFNQIFDEVAGNVTVKPGNEIMSQWQKTILEHRVQFHVDPNTNTLVWVEMNANELPWSINVKKAIIEMVLVDISGEQLKTMPDYEQTYLQGPAESRDSIHTFDIHEPTLKGHCATNYQVVRAYNLTQFEKGLPGNEKFYWRVIKTRNYDECHETPLYTHHTFDRKGCFEYCQQYRMAAKPETLPVLTQCNCKDKETGPLDQHSVTEYNIECRAYPYILDATSTGKLVVDNHGSKHAVYSKQMLTFVNITGNPLEPLTSSIAIQIKNLTYTLKPYEGMDKTKIIESELPIYNLLVPKYRTTQAELIDATVTLLNKAANLLNIENYQNVNVTNAKVASYMVRVVQNLVHMNQESIMTIYQKQATLALGGKPYTNSVRAITRQLFLDAVAHVGTKEVGLWIEKVLPTLNAFEKRNLIETLPANVFYPSKALLQTIKEKVNEHANAADWYNLEPYVISYGKLIAKACPVTLLKSQADDLTHEYEQHKLSDVIADSEKCTLEDALEYVKNLEELLESVKELRGKIMLTQALAHSRQVSALKVLEPFIKGEFTKTCGLNHNECVFLRSSIIYALHHMISVSPKEIRSLVLTVFNNKNESYELRLAAFTVLMAAGPNQPELESISATLRKEPSQQIIYMVRSVLEQTANLTEACHQPLVRVVREVLPTLPQVNLKGLYSDASYNEWYSTDKSSGFYADGQFVANNASFIPKHGYLSLGSHWKSLTTSMLTVAFQQQGLERFLYGNPQRPESIKDTIGELWENLKIAERTEEVPMLKLFFKVHEQTSLYTFDEKNLEQLVQKAISFYSEMMTDIEKHNIEYNFVRFYMPATYLDVVPSALGLPVGIIKQKPTIISIRLGRPDGFDEEEKKSSFATFSSELKITTQVYTSRRMSVSVFNQALKEHTNYGVVSLEKINSVYPVNVNYSIDFKTNTFNYVIRPVYQVHIWHHSNANKAFKAQSYIAETTKKPIESRFIETFVPRFNSSTYLIKSPEFGLDWTFDYSTERPWFVDASGVSCDGLVSVLLEKYYEFKQFNFVSDVYQNQNQENPSEGFEGSIQYLEAFGGQFEHNIKSPRQISSRFVRREGGIEEDIKAIREVGQELTSTYPSRVENPGFYIRALNSTFKVLSNQPSLFNAVFYMNRAIDYHAHWYRIDAQLLEAAPGTWELVTPRVIVDAKFERETIPSDLDWTLEKTLTATYFVNASWTYSIEEPVTKKVTLEGKALRYLADAVIPEMERESWYHKQCREDKKAKRPMTYACQQIAEKQGYYHSFEGTIVVDDSALTPIGETVYYELKRALLGYWKPWSTVSLKAASNEPNMVKFVLDHTNYIYKRPVINLYLETQNEVSNFTRFFVPIEKLTPVYPVGYLKASPLPKDQTCAYMKDSTIRTYNNLTYEVRNLQCDYVLSMDCSPYARFAVVVKDGSNGVRTIRVYTPTKDTFTIKYVRNAEALVEHIGFGGFQVKPDVTRVIVPQKGDILDSYRLSLINGVLNIEMPREEVRVAFDGSNVKITTSPKFIGKTCGLCGSQNQEIDAEFLAPNGTDLSDDLVAFLKSYAPNGCDIEPCPRGQKCDRIYNSKSKPIKPLAEKKFCSDCPYKPTRRTLVIPREHDHCFSKYPQKVCGKDQKPLKVDSVKIPMVCLTKTHPAFDKWIQDAEHRVITEVAGYATTEYFIYDSPEECRPRGI